jgi:hypothetical protein
MHIHWQPWHWYLRVVLYYGALFAFLLLVAHDTGVWK